MLYRSLFPLPQDVCTAVAALLHFFFLAVFAFMLMEGVELYILLVKVLAFGGSRKKWYILGGWGKYSFSSSLCRATEISLKVPLLKDLNFTSDTCTIDRAYLMFYLHPFSVFTGCFYKSSFFLNRHPFPKNYTDTIEGHTIRT
jgi:hypothetical protein